MQVKSIAEFSKGSILQYFWPSLSYHLSLRSLFCLILSGRFRQVLLYYLFLFTDRSGLKEPEHVERLQDAILGAFKRYIAENRPYQPVRWAKILMKVTDLRTISTRHAERVLCIRLDNSGEIPPLLLEVFNEGHALWYRSIQCGMYEFKRNEWRQEKA